MSLLGSPSQTTSESDDYGPMTDLVFSLFAVALLVLAIVGTDGKAKRATLDALLVAATAEAESARRERDEAQRQAALFAARESGPVVSPSNEELKALTDEIAELTAAARRDAAGRADEQRRLAEATAEARRMRQEKDSVEAEAERLRQAASAERAAVAAPPVGPETIGKIRPSSPAGFLQGDGLDPELVPEIRLLLGEAQGIIAEIGANRIDIEIDVAPVLNGSPNAVDDGFDESTEIARRLSRILRRTPLPFVCTAPLPFGATRASTLAGLGWDTEAGKRLDAIEPIGTSTRPNNRTRQAFDGERLADTRITLVANTIPTSVCDTSALLDGITAWIRSEVTP